MTAITDFLTGELANAFGWTLFHSLWQSVIIVFIVHLCLRFIPAPRSRARYALACGGLFLLVITSIFTFTYLMRQDPGVIVAGAPIHAVEARHALSLQALSLQAWPSTALTNITSTIQENMSLILTLWVAGFFLFAFRLAGGLLYTQKLRSGATPLENEWNEFISHAARKLGIHRLVSLAVSGAITTPMVIGYLKPVILIPAGMLTGLSTGQLETIFLHELAHIRRHDFLVNLFQSIIETVFFFNPLVWTLSTVVRREREYCCDDLVVRQHGSARVYAHALAQLAEIKHLRPGFAIALAGERNQLLTRIRRIMEKSAKNYSGRNRILIPTILLVSGLFCISWLGIQESNSTKSDSTLVDQDTIIPDNGNTARYLRRSIITIDENGQPHEEVIEEFEGDEDLRPLLRKSIPSNPGISSLFADPALPNLPGTSDTIPPKPPGIGHDQAWEEFSEAFEENFRMNFDELFSFRDEDALKFMEELKEKFGSEDFGDSSAQFNFRFPQQAFEDLKNLTDEGSFRELQEKLEQFRKFNMESLRNFEKEFQRDSVRYHGRFQDALRQELIKDGYLPKNEFIQSLEWTDEVFKVNGKEIKKPDAEKYRELCRQYANRRPLERLE